MLQVEGIEVGLVAKLAGRASAVVTLWRSSQFDRGVMVSNARVAPKSL